MKLVGNGASPYLAAESSESNVCSSGSNWARASTLTRLRARSNGARHSGYMWSVPLDQAATVVSGPPALGASFPRYFLLAAMVVGGGASSHWSLTPSGLTDHVPASRRRFTLPEAPGGSGLPYVPR